MTNPASALPVGAGPSALLATGCLLAASAVLIAVARIVNHWVDLDPLVRDGAGWIGLGCLVVGSVWRFGIWWARRFRVSIGRLMVFVAAAAVLGKAVFWLQGR